MGSFKELVKCTLATSMVMFGGTTMCWVITALLATPQHQTTVGEEECAADETYTNMLVALAVLAAFMCAVTCIITGMVQVHISGTGKGINNHPKEQLVRCLMVAATLSHGSGILFYFASALFGLHRMTTIFSCFTIIGKAFYVLGLGVFLFVIVGNIIYCMYQACYGR